MSANRIAAGAAWCCVVLFAAACGGGTSATGAAASAPTTARSGGDAGGVGGTASGSPGATGLLAQIDGTTLQVQSTGAQTAVTYSAATSFTNTVVAKPSDVVVGVCIQTRSARPAPSAEGAAPTAAPSLGNGPVIAVSVEISTPVNGSCSGPGGLSEAGTRPPGAAPDATRPTGTSTPGQTKSRGAGGNRFGVLGAFGKVTAVDGASITIESLRPQVGSATTTIPTTQTVDTSTATTYTVTQAAEAKALAVGLCVTALGTASDTGSITATSISIRPAQNGSCSSGFGRRGPGGSPTSTGGGSGA